MSRSFWIYSGALVVLLAAAWLRWTGAFSADEESQADAVIILRAEQEDIERITFHNDKLDVSITMKDDALGRYAWVELEERKKKPKPKPQPELLDDAPAVDGAAEAEDAVAEDAVAEDAAADDAAAEPGEEEAEEDFEIEVERSQFKGGDAITKLLEALAPLEAVRALGDVPQDKLADLELETPESWVEITRRGKVRKLEVGGEAYGTRDFYVRDTETGKFYLVDADVFRPLKYARSRLPDRRLSDLEQADIARVVLQSPAGRVEMVHQNRQDEQAAYWASAADPEAPVELYANWLDKALRLKGLSYVQADEAPQDLEASFEVSFVPEDGVPHNLRVFEQEDPEGGEPTWYASSEFTRGLVELHHVLASEAAQDVPDVIDAEPGEEPIDIDEEALEALAP
jgi:hypothetical protein